MTQNSSISRNGEKPCFSLIIPVYNVAPYLRECLDSVLAQTFADWECICVDDGSTDGSGDILDEYAAKDERFKVVHKTNSGVGSARNAGMDVAKGEWIGFVDGDDIINPCCLETLRNMAVRFTTADIICFKSVDFTEDSFNWDEQVAVDEPLIFDTTKRIDNMCLSGLFCEKIYRRELIGDLRFPSYPIGEDCAWQTGAVMRAKTIIKTKCLFYGYRQRQGSAIHSVQTYAKRVSAMRWRSDVLALYCRNESRLEDYCIRLCLNGLLETCFANNLSAPMAERRLLYNEWVGLIKKLAINKSRMPFQYWRFNTFLAFPYRWMAWLLFALPFWLKVHGIHR